MTRVDHRARRLLASVLLLALVIATAATAALASPDPGPGPEASTGTPATARETPAVTAEPAPTALGSPFKSGLAPLPDDRKVPRATLPPGSIDDDPGPSTVVFPVQSITIRFNHKFHVQEQGLKCVNCHAGARTSESVADHLTPKPAVCDSCHSTDHSNLAAVQPGGDAAGQCNFCHNGYRPENGNAVAPLSIPRPNMVFNHRKHADRNINCQQCHGDVQELELATRDQMPRMRGCFGCHQRADSAARGTAKAACDTCHVRSAGEGGRIKTMFASGVLQPPRWLHNAQHTPDFIERHKMVAANDSQFCANCHKEDFCVGCHDGRVRPRTIHPGDYISMHPIEARLATQKCTSCHREQSFCLGCHQRVGVAMTSPAESRNSGRFHPPKDIWSNAPRRPGHHGFEAQRNINACVSCHTERDCVTCHGAQGVGAGFNPHRGSFVNNCGNLMKKNPRPCFVCHQPSDGVLVQCR